MRNAVKWISEERSWSPEKPLQELIEKASVKFDLSPLETEYLQRLLQEH
jgi:hypothetical protein